MSAEYIKSWNQQAEALDDDASVVWDGTPAGEAASRLITAAANLLLAAAEILVAAE